MSTALLLFALGTLPCLPEGLDYLDPPEPRLEVPTSAPEASETPPATPTPAAKPASPTPVPATPSVAAQLKLVAPRVPAAKLPATGETTRYRVSYGVLGDLGEVQISYSAPHETIRASGSGSGSFFGLGKMEKRVDAELQTGKILSRRWVTSRVQSGKLIVDTVDQASPGEIAVLRRRTGRPEEGHRFSRQTQVLDPLAFLFRLRSRPPQQAETFEVLDGRALWRIVVAPTRVQSADARTVLIVAGKADPIFWDGQPDSDRTARSFTLYMEGDAQHTPLRLVMPLSVGEVRVELTQVSHPPAASTPGRHPAKPTERTALVNRARR